VWKEELLRGDFGDLWCSLNVIWVMTGGEGDERGRGGPVGDRGNGWSDVAGKGRRRETT
jgi:hypothetical protein